MADALSWTGDRLAAIPLEEPERLFPNDRDAAKARYRALARKWHPDHNPGQEAVFEHVAALYRAVLAKIAAGNWQPPGRLILKPRRGGTEYRIRFHKRHTLEIGDMYVADSVVAFVLPPENQDLFERAQRTIEGFVYADDAMRAEVSRCLPVIKAAFVSDAGPVLIVSKTPDQLLLKDVVEHFKTGLDPRHVGWMQNILYNLACYLDWSGLTHNAIGLDTMFVSPQHHSGALLGGWWDSVRTGQPMIAAPSRTITYAPADFLARKVGDIRVDLELVRLVGRELLGDARGLRLMHDRTVPRPMADWLCLATTGEAATDYRQWGEVLRESYGDRRFIALELTASDLYQGA